MNVAVLGASSKPERVSHQAIELLLRNGHNVFPVHPIHKEILGQRVYASLSAIGEPIDTVSMYVNAERSAAMADEFLRLKPRRVLFSPGAENPELEEILRKNGIQVMEACTLVLLHTKQF